MFLLSRSCFLADKNMAADSLMLKLSCRFSEPFLRIYDWAERSATCGYSQSVGDFSRESLCGLDKLVRRPVGGGLVIHELCDITYALSVPANHEFFLTRPLLSYALLHKTIALCLADFDCHCSLNASDSPRAKTEPAQCFKYPSANDLMLGGGIQKLAGAAQRRTRDGLLVQGSIKLPYAISDKKQEVEAKLSLVFSEMLNSDFKLADFSNYIGRHELAEAAKSFPFIYI